MKNKDYKEDKQDGVPSTEDTSMTADEPLSNAKDEVSVTITDEPRNGTITTGESESTTLEQGSSFSSVQQGVSKPLKNSVASMEGKLTSTTKESSATMQGKLNFTEEEFGVIPGVSTSTKESFGTEQGVSTATKESFVKMKGKSISPEEEFPSSYGAVSRSNTAKDSSTVSGPSWPPTLNTAMTVRFTDGASANDNGLETTRIDIIGYADIECAGGGGSEAIFNGNFHPIVKIDDLAKFRYDSSDGTSSYADLIGCICLCPFDRPADVNHALIICKVRKATALLTILNPLQLFLKDIPVFQISESAAESLLGHRGMDVSLQSFPVSKNLAPVSETSTKCRNDKASDESIWVPINNHGPVKASMPFTDGNELNPVDLVTNFDSSPSHSIGLGMKPIDSSVTCSKWILTVCGKNATVDGDRNSWDVAASCMAKCDDLIVDTRRYKMQIASVHRNESTKQVKGLTHNPTDAVLCYGSSNISDIHRVHQCASERGAAALIVSCQPKLVSSIPLFVVDRKDLQKLCATTLGTVKFQKSKKIFQTNHPLASPITKQEVGKRTSQSHASYAEIAATGLGENNERRSGVHALRLPSRTRYEVTSSQNCHDDLTNVEAGAKKPKDGKNWLTQAISKAKDFVMGDTPEPLMSPLRDRTEKSIMESYRMMSGKIASACANEDASKIEFFASQAIDFLGNKDCGLCHIAAGAYLCSAISEPSKIRSLAASVFTAIAKSSSSEDELNVLVIKKRSQDGRFRELRVSMRKEINVFVETQGHHLLVVGCPGTLMIKILLLLRACGLFRRKFEPSLWRLLRSLPVDTSTFDGESGALLLAAVDEKDANTFVSCFRRDLEDFADLVTGYRVPMEAFHDIDWLGGMLILLIENEVAICPKSAKILSCWASCMKIFKGVAFKDAIRKDAISQLIAAAIHREHGDFELLGEMMESLSDGHPELNTTQECVMRAMADKLNQRKSNWTVVKAILANPHLSRLLHSWKIRNNFLEFVDDAIQKWTIFEEKLLLIDGISSLYSDLPQHRLKSLLSTAMAKENKSFVLKSSVALAVENPSLFVASNQSARKCEDVAEILVVCAKEAAGDPILLRDLGHTEDPKALLYHALIRHLRRGLLQECGSLEKATRFYAAVFGSASGMPVEVAKIAIDAFVMAFKRWDPREISDVGLEHKACLDAIFTIRADESNNDCMVNKCRQRLVDVVEECLGRYDADSISRDELLSLMLSVKAHIWSGMEASVSFAFPRAAAIEEKLDQFSSLEESIKDSLSVSVAEQKVTLELLLCEYSCDLGETHNIFHDYQYLFPDNGATRRVAKTIRDMDNDASLLLTLTSDVQREIYLCAYFVVHRSVLFRDRVLRKDGKMHDLKSLCDSVREALCWFECAFGLESNYAGVRAAKVALGALEMNEELKILVECDDLKISTADTEMFRLILVLSDMSSSLPRFVEFCEQFGFETLTHDEKFRILKDESQAFYTRDPEQNAVDVCFQFSICVCTLFYPQLDPSWFSDSICKITAKLVSMAPFLNMFFSIVQYPELWSYVDEMEWFGPDGLTLFYEEYNNVTNVLLGDSESYEMSLLDSMASVVRVVSKVGSLRHSCESVDMLLEGCYENEDINTALSKGIDFHIRQIQGKLLEIKDWFSNGVNEIAAAHTLFSAAANSGSFFMSEQVLRDSGNNTHPQEYVLTLEFKANGQPKLLQGEKLDHFVQQLSLIQNEKRSGSVEDMQSFIDQYQLISRACHNLLKMVRLGYEKTKLAEFRCEAGGRFTDDANMALKTSEMHLFAFTAWLDSTLERFPVSLLFWTDELRSLHEIVESMTELPDQLSMLCDVLSRIQALCEPETQIRERLLTAIETCVVAHQGRIALASIRDGWLLEASQFLSDCCGELGYRTGATECGQKSCIMELHSYVSSHGKETRMVLTILHHIYKDRPPWSFEVLDGAAPCDCDRMSLFLKRTLAFPSFRFTIANVDLLESNVLEKLLAFLSDRENASRSMSLFCIQRGRALHASPWVSERSWDYDTIGDELPKDGPWRSADVFSALTVVSSKGVGSGKTRFIRDRLDTVKESKHCGSLPIHERSSVASLVESLRRQYSGNCHGKALHVSFSFLGHRSNGDASWIREMNYFFFSMLSLRSIYDPLSAQSFAITGCWDIDFELPVDIHKGATSKEWLDSNIPIISQYSEFVEPPKDFVIDEPARRVALYLRAFSTGTINRKFEEAQAKRIILVLDCSGSMQGSKFDDAVRNAVSIFDSHVIEGDDFGVVLFDHQIYTPIPIQVVRDKYDLRRAVQNLPFYCGGTSMYQALSNVLQLLSQRDASIESWIVCLTDGESDLNHYDLFRQQIAACPSNLHLISIGIGLRTEYEHTLRQISKKYTTSDPKGFFVRSDGTTTGTDAAFATVKSRIPVSQTFDLDGQMSAAECRHYIHEYLPTFVEPEDMISQTFWIRFLYRRVQVFDSNDSFNYNEKHDSLGSSLMEVMLSEVERLLGKDLRQDWLDTNHAQLIYDFTNATAPEFRLVCTAPEKLDLELREKLSELDLPGFSIPTQKDLDNRRTLDRYLSQALGVPLQTNDDGSEVLQCLDDNRFILTLDFTMKLLSLHERVACRIPCLIEGETGVSKSALTKMYSILRNSALESTSRLQTTRDLEEIVATLRNEGLGAPECTTDSDRLRAIILHDGEAAAARITELLNEKLRVRPSIFASYEHRSNQWDSTAQAALHILDFFVQSTLVKTFFNVNVDASLTEADFVDIFSRIRDVACKLQDATVVVFLDEINTSTVLGLLKEVVIDRSIAGDMLEDNIVIVAALNPPRAEIEAHGRERDLGLQWASGHYQVSSIPGSMEQLKWIYGSLTHSQEKDFIKRRIEALNKTMSKFIRISLTEVVSASHEIMRLFAKRNILDGMRRAGSIADPHQMEVEAKERAQSIVSLRDIQRVFGLFEFFSEDLKNDTEWIESERQRRSMLLAVATVYYLRLDDRSRNEFLSMLRGLPTEAGRSSDFMKTLNFAMMRVISGTEVGSGIALTRGLKENVFITLVCSMSQTPLLIVGPPGTSKTLAVNVVDSNANGSDSMSRFYAKRPRLSLFHYQCSKQSTSKEIKAVFDQAIQRQERVNSSEHRCVVFMDEAGLPESERESLKVLHYLLEGHMSAKARVGFVAISNHVLDAAKSNRCILLLRQDPDFEEMKSITDGVLFDMREDGRNAVHDVDVEKCLMTSQDFSSKLCMSYSTLFEYDGGLSHLATFFGLRDYIYFLKALKEFSRTELPRFYTSFKALIRAIERNFNGVPPEEMRGVALCFLKHLSANTQLELRPQGFEIFFRHPIAVLKQALTASSTPNGGVEVNRPRFKLIVDSSEDDSILRLLSRGGVVEVSNRSLYKLSNLPDGVDIERLKLVSGVKFAALQGNLAVLSQTEPINESFYDLFNQRFREVMGRDGKVSLYANIAVGGISRRSRVSSDFECVVHIRESKLDEIPAPFLNRFEKYRLTLKSMLTSWTRYGSMSFIVRMALERTTELASVLSSRGDSFGWMKNPQTIDSLFIDLLPQLDSCIWTETCNTSLTFPSKAETFEGVLRDFLARFTSLSNISSHIEYVIEMAKSVLLSDDFDVLEQYLENLSSPENLVRALQSLVLGECDETRECKMLSKVIQMILTRASVIRLIQLATPESIFALRHELPPAVIKEYFRQEHFSLKRVIMDLTAEVTQSSGLAVIHTRSDAMIHSIPTLAADRPLASESPETVEAVLKFVHEKGPHSFIIENFSRLRSEALVRGAIQTWTQDVRRHIFLLFVDMSEDDAQDRTNFVRMVVEQHLHNSPQKYFVLLLHYSPSRQDKSQCYSALFLGWEHIFVDSAGNDSSVYSDYVRLACCHSNNCLAPSSGSCIDCVHRVIKGLVPQILPALAGQNLFYKNQSFSKHKKFHHRKTVLQRLLNAKAGQGSIGDILCEKFASLWIEQALFSTTREASEGLLQRTTQLSLSMSIHGVLAQSFQMFLSLALAESNHWMNFDLLFQNSTSPEVLELFGLCLQQLPTLPFQELMLHQNPTFNKRLPPLPTFRQGKIEPKFPFFYFFSSIFDEIIEIVHERHANTEKRLSVNECLRAAVNFLEEDQKTDRNCSLDQERRSLVNRVLDYISSQNGDGKIFIELYTHQLIEWKFGCAVGSIVLMWFRERLDSIAGKGSILSIHIVSVVEQSDLLRIASIESLLKILGDGADGTILTPNANLFECIVDIAERAMSRRQALDKEAWSMISSFILRQGGVTMQATGVSGEETTLRLRRLHMFLLCDKFCLAKLQDLPINWLENRTRNGLSKESLSLSRMVESIEFEDAEQEIKAVQVMLKHFLSPAWRLDITRDFQEDDLSYLLDIVKEGTLTSHQTCVSLLRRCTGAEKQKWGYSVDMLLRLNSEISCVNLSKFSPNSGRSCIPHFIPEWLRREQLCTEGNETCPLSGEIFFANYEHCFDCRLSSILFDLLLSTFACEAEHLNSEQLFLQLQREVEAEISLDSQTHARFSRLEIFGEERPLRGTAVAAIALSARVLCFVAKIANECGGGEGVLVLSSAYSGEAVNFMDNLLSQQTAFWQFFLMGTILKQRGEGTLASIITTGGVLACLECSREWAEGVPELQRGALESLQRAETALREAIEEEEGKRRDFRLCPHCRQPFIVDQLNCGHFVCGRDFHGADGRLQNNSHGCGQGFALITALGYVPDERILEPLRANIKAHQATRTRRQEASTLWLDARVFIVPTVLYVVRADNPHRFILPHKQLLSSAGNDGRCERLVEVLWDASEFASRIRLLPDLIELYIWLHDTFRFLVSREDAYKLFMRDLMTREQLMNRFDTIRVNHLLQLWGRCVLGVDEILAKADQKVSWECGKVSVPFGTLQDASMMSLLSEGECPTDGNDFLFLILNETVNAYNSFAENLGAFSCEGSEPTPPVIISPKHCVRGLIGAVKVGAIVPLTRQELGWMAECCWSADGNEFDQGRLHFELLMAVNMADRPPLISNPMDSLRESFSFRNDETLDLANNLSSAPIFKFKSCFFANRQDRLLVEEVDQFLGIIDATIGDETITQTFVDNLHGLTYDDLRGVLGGIRTFFDVMVNRHHTYHFDRIGTALDEMLDDNPATGLQVLGFPELTDKQTQLLLSLDVFQTVELIKFLNHQLASEAYIFAGLPIYMATSLEDGTKDSIREQLEALWLSKDSKRVVGSIDEFIHDILGFYENEIVKAVAKSDTSLRSFLSQSNFCDASDPIFASLPSDVTLRNYIALRQLLHQIKLDFKSRIESSPEISYSTMPELKNSSMTTTERGRCWLWEDKGFPGVVGGENLGSTSEQSFGWKLWFEQAISVSATTSAEKDITAIEEMMEECSTQKEGLTDLQHSKDVGPTSTSEEEESKAAVRLQRWWRIEFKNLQTMDFSNDEEDEDIALDYRMEDEEELLFDYADGDQMVLDGHEQNNMSREVNDASRGHAPAPMDFEPEYGSPNEELDMRKWLDSHKLPQSTMDVLAKSGVRNIEDICFMLVEMPEILLELPRLDQLKLKKAARTLVQPTE